MQISRICLAGTVWVEKVGSAMRVIEYGSHKVYLHIPIDGNLLKKIKDTYSFKDYISTYTNTGYKMVDSPEEIQDNENYFIAICREDKTINIVTMNFALRRTAMSEENKKATSSNIDDHTIDIYDIDKTSMYDINMIEENLKPSNILGKINIPENKCPNPLDGAELFILDSTYTMWRRSDESPNQDMNKKILKRMAEKPFITSTK